jgi:K+-transporting ATPase KdpF subunit
VSTADDVIGLVLAVLVIAYLVVALVFPERL